MAAEFYSSSASSGLLPDLIFLSYARVDRAEVETIAATLRARGASVWYDTDSTAGGASYVESSQRALRRTNLMLVFLSASSVKSAWVAEEVRAYRSLMAREPGHKLLVIHLDKTRLPLSLAGASAVDARGLTAQAAVNLIAHAADMPSWAQSQSPTTAPHTTPVSVNDASPAVASASLPASEASTPPQLATDQDFASHDHTDHDHIEPTVASFLDAAPVLEAASMVVTPTLMEATSAETLTMEAPVEAALVTEAIIVIEEPPAAPPPMEAAPMAETAPAMEAVAPVTESAPATLDAIPVAAALPAEPAPVAEVRPVAAPAASVTERGATPRPEDLWLEKAEWNRTIGPVVLLIVLLIALLFALWVHAGYPLPGAGQ